jgi:hypothetical protein
MIRCRRAFIGGGIDDITIVFATISEAPQLEQKALPTLFGREHCGQGTVRSALDEGDEGIDCTSSVPGEAS